MAAIRVEAVVREAKGDVAGLGSKFPHNRAECIHLRRDVWQPIGEVIC